MCVLWRAHATFLRQRKIIDTRKVRWPSLEVIALLKVRDDLTADESGQTLDKPLCLKVVLFSRFILDVTSNQISNFLHACDLAVSKTQMWRLIYHTNSAHSIFVYIINRDRCKELDLLVVRRIVLCEITYDTSGAVSNNIGSIDDTTISQAQAQHLCLPVTLVNTNPAPSL